MRSSSDGRPTIAAARREAYAWDRPWKPYLRSAQRLRHCGRDRVGRGRGRHPGMERGVEAGHGRHVRQDRLHRGQGGERLGLVERGEVGQRLEVRLDRVVDADRAAIARPAVDDPVADRPRPRRSRRSRPRSPRRPRIRGAPAGRPSRPPRRVSSRTRSLRLLEPALTTRIRALAGLGGALARVVTASPAPATASRGSRAHPRRRVACRRGTRGAGRPSAGAGGRPGSRSPAPGR